ncbi:MAG: ATP-binding cassette domain-containing protein [Bifidobacteriaceae bacterium]|jgi:ABC-type sugar transport system ATPase subunit|nr:ATP-binding cassette domain-containing protein [Bifidobacteriaceae bacterium]
MNSELVLEAKGLAKRYGAVVALAHGDFGLRAAEVHAMVGDNGAGKSTLLKLMAGAVRPTSGELLVGGVPVSFSSPRDAQRQGIATVFQNLGMIDHLDATANLFLGREEYLPVPLKWLGILDKRKMRAQAVEAVGRLKINVRSVDALLGGMSGGQRQAVAVARAAAFGSRAVIMDEPTAALGVRETAAVLDMIRHVKAQGIAVVLVSHRLDEVFAVTDRITVLRRGRTVATNNTADVSREDVVGMMTGAFVPSI